MESERVQVAAVGISHPDRVLFETAGITKLDLARYYEAIGTWIMPHLEGRPLTLVRCPQGVSGAAGKGADPECFYMKHSSVWAPAALRRVKIREKKKVGEYLVADSVSAVVALAQMDMLEIHTWNSRVDTLERPDRIVIDLDPGSQVGWPQVIAAARRVRHLLGAFDLESFVKTTGGRGLHVVVPLTPRADWSECLEFARGVAQLLVRREPGAFTDRFAKAGRDDKILVDYLRNNRTNTSIAAYSTRARPTAPVSVPVAWNELTESNTPDRFTLQTVRRRLSRLRKDPWQAYVTTKQTIPRGAVNAMASME